MVNRFIFILSLVVLAIILVFLFFTSPTNIGPLGILFFFVMVYFLSFGVVTFFMTFFVRIFFSRKEMIKKDIEIGLKYFKAITINVFVDNGTTVKRDDKKRLYLCRNRSDFTNYCFSVNRFGSKEFSNFSCWTSVFGRVKCFSFWKN